MPKEEPRAHISWPKEGFKVSGQIGALAMGSRVRVVVEGKVTGFSMAPYGCSVDLSPSGLRVEGLEGAKGEKSMVEQVLEIKPTKKGG